MCGARATAYLTDMQDIDEDERALQFDVHLLEAGDPVDIYLDTSGLWHHGRVEVSHTGIACVALADGRRVRMESAVLMGLRRVLN
jgi:hypothetical protein